MTTTAPLPPHVLAIDDDPAMRQLVADHLGGNDLRVTTVATGAEMNLRTRRLTGPGDVQILRLRRKIEPNPSAPEYIKTERGAGYMFDAPVEILR